MKRAVLDVIWRWSFKQRAAAFLVLGVAILAVFHIRIYNSLAGPFDVEERDVVAMKDVPFKRLVRVVRDGRPVEYSELARAPFYEEEIHSGYTEATASFRYLEVNNHRMLVRIADSTDPDVIGLLDVPDDRLASHASGAPLFLDCDKAAYGAYSLLALVAGLAALFFGLDQLRRAYRRPVVERPLRLFT
jgi:hypothetical protein